MGIKGTLGSAPPNVPIRLNTVVPELWVGTQHLTFLDEPAQRVLNHLRAFSYVHLFRNYEEFIPIPLMALAQQDWPADRAQLRALVRFGEEELSSSSCS